MNIQYHLLKITGKVQGVFYRNSAKLIADELNIRGWIKNEEDGTVTAFVSGLKENIDEFVAWCEIGPPAAEVDEVIRKETDRAYYESFEIVK